MTAIQLLQELRTQDLDWFRREWSERGEISVNNLTLVLGALHKITDGLGLPWAWASLEEIFNSKQKQQYIEQAIYLLQQQAL